MPGDGGGNVRAVLRGQRWEDRQQFRHMKMRLHDIGQAVMSVHDDEMDYREGMKGGELPQVTEGVKMQ